MAAQQMQLEHSHSGVVLGRGFALNRKDIVQHSGLLIHYKRKKNSALVDVAARVVGGGEVQSRKKQEKR